MKIHELENIVNKINKQMVINVFNDDTIIGLSQKLEEIKYLYDSYDNMDKDLKQILVDNNFHYFVYKIITDSNILKNRSLNEIKKLIEYLKDSNYMEYVFYIITNKKILEETNVEIQIYFIECLKESFYKKSIFCLITDNKFRNTKEKLKMLEILKKNNFDEVIESIFTQKTLLSRNSFSDQLKLVEKYLELNDNNLYSSFAGYEITKTTNINKQLKLLDLLNEYDNRIMVQEIITNINVLNCRTIDEIKKLLDILKEYDYIENVFNTIIDGYSLENLDIDTHLFLIRQNQKNQSEKIKVDTAIKNSDSIDEIKCYISQLKKMNTDEINKNKKILKYKNKS